MKKLYFYLFLILIFLAAIFIVIYFLPKKDFRDSKENNYECINAGNDASEYSFGKYVGPKTCCDGLIKIEILEEENEECFKIPDSGVICSDCGNGFCEEWENLCNCPQDCS